MTNQYTVRYITVAELPDARLARLYVAMMASVAVLLLTALEGISLVTAPPQLPPVSTLVALVIVAFIGWKWGR